MAVPTDPRSPAARAKARLVPAASALVLAISLIVAGIAYVVGTALPTTYQSSGLIRVAVLSQQGITDPAVLAGNDLATQIAQLADSEHVRQGAEQTLGLKPGSLSGKITGSTLGAQNLVQVTANGSSTGSARARASAATTALWRYQLDLNRSAVSQYLASVDAALGPLQQEIQAIYARIGKDSPAVRAADQVQLQTLLTTRSQVIGQVARDAATNRPDLQVVSDSSAPSVVYPKPALYALVAFLVALIIAGRVAFMVVSRTKQQ